jgi:hypothetical protein
MQAKPYIMTKHIAYALVATLLATSAHAIDVFEEGVSCSKQGIGCSGPANPEIVAALKKRYPSADEIWAIESLENGKYRYSVAFVTTKSNMQCRLTLNPIKFSNCGRRHA